MSYTRISFFDATYYNEQEEFCQFLF